MQRSAFRSAIESLRLYAAFGMGVRIDVDRHRQRDRRKAAGSAARRGRPEVPVPVRRRRRRATVRRPSARRSRDVVDEQRRHATSAAVGQLRPEEPEELPVGRRARVRNRAPLNPRRARRHDRADVRRLRQGQGEPAVRVLLWRGRAARAVDVGPHTAEREPGVLLSLRAADRPRLGVQAGGERRGQPA